MKRFLLLVLAAALIVGCCMTACSSKTSTSSEETIKVATDATWAPFETVNEKTKQIQGFDIDLFNAIAAKGRFQNSISKMWLLTRCWPVWHRALTTRPFPPSPSLPTDKKRCCSLTRTSMPGKSLPSETTTPQSTAKMI